MRFKIELPIDMPQPEVEKAVLNDPKANKWMDGKTYESLYWCQRKSLTL
jgi:leucyl-tRNA synthetase